LGFVSFLEEKVEKVAEDIYMVGRKAHYKVLDNKGGKNCEFKLLALLLARSRLNRKTLNVNSHAGNIGNLTSVHMLSRSIIVLVIDGDKHIRHP
jgi:hypothetical protein